MTYKVQHSSFQSQAKQHDYIHAQSDLHLVYF